MDDIPLTVQLGVLALLLAISAFFSLSETAMMASNRFRLRHLAQNGHNGAQKALSLLNTTDKMLGVILLGNNLINAAAATLVSVITIELFGEGKWALGAGTLAVTFAILVFAEITPKIIGATHADRLALVLGYILTPLLRLFYPIVWFINLFASMLLRTLRLTPSANNQPPQLSQEELLSLVLESSHIIPQKHRTILSSLFELNRITVEDVMTPRGNIEILDLDRPWEEVKSQLATSHHSRLPACRESLDQLLGILPVRRLLGSIGDDSFDESTLMQQVQPPYYIPAGTPVFSQLAFFQENRQRIGFVVDEYGEILGLLTLEDIIEEFVGDFTTSIPGLGQELNWSEKGEAIVEGSRQLRDINRMLGLDFPLDGPKTLNGLILEHFQDIPESGISIKLAGIAVEILQTKDRRVVTVRIFRPAPG
ncbi:HlyC/CorC family transporter [Dechloromonas sp. CZR5]|uniref:HlyC/CorC family transporter n=1 Tax=Dechloromonas sp. CZR5 TaxID=2608630 RepID=UPI00123CF0E1|nr:HlyC/CorC family transporter [Dechloromonas sp. CZR5]